MAKTKELTEDLQLLLVAAHKSGKAYKAISELLASNLDLAQSQFINIIECYRPLSASAEALTSIAQYLSNLESNELLLAGDLICDWLT